MFLDSLIENNDILMCKVIGEKSGSTLIKLRVKDPKNGGQCNVGEVTQKSKVEFKPVTLKQVKKDYKIGSQKRDGQPTGHIMKTRSRNDTELMEEPRSSSPIHEYIPIPSQVTSPDAVMDSADVTPECLCFPDQSPVQPYQSTHMSVDESDQSSVQPNQSTHMSADESGHSPVQFHQNTQMPGCEEETYKSDSQSDSASVVSDNSQLETSSVHSEESNTKNIDIADIKPETHVQYSMAQMTAFLLTDRGKQCITSAVADGFRDVFNPVDDT